MRLRDIIAGGIGAIVGGVVTYVLVSRMYEKEIDEIYGAVDEGLEDLTDVLKEYNGMDETEVHVDDIGQPFETIVRRDGELQFRDLETDEVEEVEEESLPAPVDDDATIFVIDKDQVQPGMQVVGNYNHEDGSLEIITMMSPASQRLDEIVQPEELEILINPEALATIKAAGAPEPDADRRMIAVRNTEVNLDMVIIY